jgi:ubiquinone/menaquinone biosynthesis C-methylase UbiE
MSNVPRAATDSQPYACHHERHVSTDRFTASGFPAVDDAGDADRYVQYLDAQAATPFWRAAKRASIEALELPGGGATALDVGCGTGEEVRVMAPMAGAAVGVDASRFFVEEARRRTGLEYDARFEQARAEELPFEDESFDAVRTERTLQHVDDLGSAIGEMWRVAKPGAGVVALEPDWDTLVFDAGPLASTRAVTRAWADSIRNPVAGRQTARRLRKLGALDVRAEPRTAAITELAFAEEQYGLTELAERTLNPAAARAWLGTLAQRDAEGAFLAAATYFLVSCRKPVADER